MPDVAYVPTGIPELDDNPLVRSLPPLVPLRELYRLIERVPSCSQAERNLAPHLRAFLVVTRMKKAFVPTGAQATFAQKVNNLIRSGYDGVSLADTSYAARLAELADQVEAGRPLVELSTQFQPTAYCGTLIGPSGMGKTTTLNRVLEGIPQVIVHHEPVTVKQVVHLKLECPATGSPKQLCLSFFGALDQLVGTEYSKKFGGLATEHLVLRMAQSAQVHRLGLLVVDEIQYLRTAKIQEDDVLNLLTTLVNVINVPVLMVGTMAAVPLMTRTFRSARRAEGVASAIFQPMKKDDEWDWFLQKLFRLQWTAEVTELSAELSGVLWDESQGIVDIAVKLFTLAQLRLIQMAETRTVKEIIKPSLIRKIAKEELRLVRPMLRALARGSATIEKYDDLRPLERHFQDLLGGFSSGIVDLPVPLEPKPEAQPPGESQAALSLASALAGMGFAPDVAEAFVAAARKEVPSGDPVAMLAAVSAMVAPASVKKQERPRKRAGSASQASSDPQDVRRFGGSGRSESVYDGMVAEGLIGSGAALEAA
jgi:hypothetical protein